MTTMRRALAERAHVRAEVEVLREALRAYGQHLPDCGDVSGCTCGFSAALAEPRKT